MKTSRFWKPVIISVISTPIFLFLAMMSAGIGHGSYTTAMALFPFTMLSAFVFGSITIPFIFLTFAQFPIYGVILGLANEKGNLRGSAVKLLSLHAIAAAFCFLPLIF